jgi:hypothetical protein
MKKNKLIELLQSLEGNPDIVLWNGFVGDWMDIDATLVEGSLVKQPFAQYHMHVEFEEKRDRKDFTYTMPEAEITDLKKSYAKYCVWESNDFVTRDDIKAGRYLEKKVFYINAKLRGVSTFDRHGTIEY